MISWLSLLGNDEVSHISRASKLPFRKAQQSRVAVGRSTPPTLSSVLAHFRKPSQLARTFEGWKMSSGCR